VIHGKAKRVQKIVNEKYSLSGKIEKETFFSLKMGYIHVGWLHFLYIYNFLFVKES